MGRVRTVLGDLALIAFLGCAVGDCLGLVAALVATILGWVDGDGALVLVLLVSGAGALVAVLAAIAYQTPAARAWRERPRTPLEVRLAQQRRRWRAERRARWRRWWTDVLPVAVLKLLGVTAALLFTVSCVFSAMIGMGFDDPRHVPAGAVIALILGIVLIRFWVRSTGGRSTGGGGSTGGADFLDSGDV